MTVSYWSPLLRTMVCMTIFEQHGRRGWCHALDFFAGHEACDNRRVRGFSILTMKPFELGMAMAASEVGKNTSRPRPWD